MKNRKKLKIFVVILIAFALIFGYLNFYVFPQIFEVNKAKIKSNTISVMDNSIYNTILKNDYDDLISITKNDDGDIVLMQVNSKNANKLNNDIVSDIQKTLNEQNKIECYIPAGNFTGMPLFSGLGPNVKINVVPIGSVHTKFDSQFVSVGINQSFHKIYINISVEVCMLLPLYTQNVVVKNQVLVAESIIVGKVPTTYLNTDNLTNALNLIP